MPSLNPQATTVLAHLRTHGHLTSWQAEGVYRIRRLASRVDELRAAGYEIATQTCRDATGQRYTRYDLTNRQRKASKPLLAPRTVAQTYRLSDLLRLYHAYCIEELGLPVKDANDEVQMFTEFLKEAN